MTSVCPPPLCGTYELRVIDVDTGAIIDAYNTRHVWDAEATRLENQPGIIVVEFANRDGCCIDRISAWCVRLELWRDCGCRVGCWWYTGSAPTEDGTIQWFGVTPMWLALRQRWSRDYRTTRSTTDIFELALDQAELAQPLGIARQPVPINVDVTIDVAQRDDLAATWEQLATGTLEWTEYHNGPYCSTVRYGNIAYDAGYQLSAQDWDGDPPPPFQDGTRLASTVRVESERTEEVENEAGELEEVTTSIAAEYPPPDEDGRSSRGSQKVSLPVTVQVEGLVDEDEAAAVALRLWEKMQNGTFMETPDGGLSQSSKLCVCDAYPGAIYRSSIESSCETVDDDFRLTEMTVKVKDGLEVGVSPVVVGGQA